MIVGLTGGLASGKSFVAAELRSLGCVIIEADELGHAVLAAGGEAHDAVLRRFGTTDRRSLARIVFTDPKALTDLNAIVHPAVRQRFRADVARHPSDAIVVYVAAILIESGGYRDVEKLIVVTCPREMQIARALERPGATLADVLARLDRQMANEKRREFADYAIDTGGTKDETLSQIRIVFEELKRLS